MFGNNNARLSLPNDAAVKRRRLQLELRRLQRPWVRRRDQEFSALLEEMAERFGVFAYNPCSQLTEPNDICNYLAGRDTTGRTTIHALD